MATPLTFPQFREQYKAGLKGNKYDSKELGKEWKKYQKQVGKEEKKQNVIRDNSVALDGAVHDMLDAPKADDPVVSVAAEKSDVAVTAQAGEVMVKSDAEEKPKATLPAVSVTLAPGPGQDAILMYENVAEAIHQTCANLITLFTENRIKLESDKLKRLNTCGAYILRKYDKDGKILEYSPELAYVLTLADVATMVWVDIKKHKVETQNGNAGIQKAST